jgi:hypothetical protein
MYGLRDILRTNTCDYSVSSPQFLETGEGL